MRKLDKLINEGISNHLIGSAEEGHDVMDTIYHTIIDSGYLGKITDAEIENKDFDSFDKLTKEFREDVITLTRAKIENLIDKESWDYIQW